MVLDYARSFLTFVTPGGTNHARIQVEARCRIGDVETWLVASCKAEETYGTGDLFRLPNYDFAALFTRERYRICRIGATHDPAMQESGPIVPRFAQVVYQLRETPARRCETASEVVDATLLGLPLVARCTIEHDGVEAVLEYPIKTMNVHPPTGRYQLDTGPLVLPTGDAWHGALDEFAIVFAAFNREDQLELIARAPHRLAGGDLVDHYGERLVLPARNEVWAVTG